MSVVLPAPLGPTIAVTLCEGNAKSTWSRATVPPNTFVRFSHRSAMSCGVPSVQLHTDQRGHAVGIQALTPARLHREPAELQRRPRMAARRIGVPQAEAQVSQLR